MKNKKSTQDTLRLKIKGFSLIELLVVTALIGVLAVMASTIFSSILRSQNKTAIINEVRQNGNLVIDKFEREVKQASEVSMTNCPPNCEGPTVTLTNYSGGNTTWDCAGTEFMRDGGSGLVSVINTDLDNGVQVDAGSCSFTVTEKVSNRPQIVRLNFTLSQRSSVQRAEFQATSEFEVTVGTRAY